MLFGAIAFALTPSQMLAQQPSVNTNGLVAFYRFDGDAKDSSGFNRNATTVSSVTYGTDRFGNLGKAATFVASKSSTVTIPSFLEANSDQISISLWVRPTAKATGKIITKDDGTSKRQYLLQLEGATSIGLGVWANNGSGNQLYGITHPYDYKLSEWCHLCMTWDGSMLSLYINGVLGKSINAPGKLVKYTDIPLRIGSEGVLNALAGDVDEVSVYNRSLSAVDIQSIYSGNSQNNSSTNSPTVITIDPPTRSFDRNGGGGAVLTSGSGKWSAKANVDWILLLQPVGDAGTSCKYFVNANFSADTRQGTVSIGDKTHTITQSGATASLVPLNANYNKAGGSGNVAVTVDPGVTWLASSNAGWIAVTPTVGISSGSVTYTVAPYDGVVARSGSLTIAGRTFSISQTGVDVRLSPALVEKSHGTDVVIVQVNALSTTTWSVTSDASWISVVDSGNKAGDSSVTLAIGSNPSFLERIGTVRVGSATLKVVQAGTPNPVLDINPKEATADPIGAFGNVAVMATPGLPWAAESMSSWLTLAKGTDGAGNGNVQYVASANPSLEQRFGTLKFTPSVYEPKVDLTRDLRAHIYEGALDAYGDASGWGHDLSGRINQAFTGTNTLTMYGEPFQRENDAFSLTLWFFVAESGSIHRLAEADRADKSFSTLFVNADDQLVFKSDAETLVSRLKILPKKWYQVVLTVDADKRTRIFLGERGVGPMVEVGNKVFIKPPFPKEYVAPIRLRLATGNQPSLGNLFGGLLNDLRVYGRALREEEAVAIFNYAGTATPYGDTRDGGDEATVLEYNLRGQCLPTGGKLRTSTWLNGGVDQFIAYAGREQLGSLIAPRTGNQKTYVIGKRVLKLYTRRTGQTHIVYGMRYSDGSAFDMPIGTAVLVGGEFVLNNPFPEKIVQRIELSANSLTVSDSTVTTDFVSGDNMVGMKGTDVRKDRFGLSLRAVGMGPSSFISVPGHNTAFADSSATYNFWIQVNDATLSSPTFQTLFARNGLTASIGGTNRIRLTQGAVSTEFNVPAEAGRWHMLTVAGAFGSSVRIYWDGEEVGNSAQFAGYRFGGDKAPVQLLVGGWSGAIDYMGFYDGALSSSQIRTIYAKQRAQIVYHTVTQGVVEGALSPQTAEIPVMGGTVSTTYLIPQNVNWTIKTTVSWLTVTSPETGAGPVTIQALAAANPTVYERTGGLEIGNLMFTVTQAGLGANVSHAGTLFPVDGGSASVDVTTEGNAQWEAVSNVPWLTVFLGAQGMGAGSVLIVADPYTNTSQSRSGSVTIAGKVVNFTQRGYLLSISPQVAEIGSNAGVGEFGVAAPLTAIWEAIVNQPWITLLGSSTGSGSGTVRFSVAANTTGQTRTGRIAIAGEEYTITQNPGFFVTVVPTPGGNVTGGGVYSRNDTVKLVATPMPGYAFSNWSGDVTSNINPLILVVDTNKTIQATFIQSTSGGESFTNGVQSVLKNPNNFGLYTSDQIRSMAIGKPVLQINPQTGKGKILFSLRQSDDLGSWNDLPVSSADVFVRDGKLEVEFTPAGKAAFYRLLGSEVQ